MKDRLSLIITEGNRLSTLRISFENLYRNSHFKDHEIVFVGENMDKPVPEKWLDRSVENGRTVREWIEKGGWEDKLNLKIIDDYEYGTRMTPCDPSKMSINLQHAFEAWDFGITQASNPWICLPGTDCYFCYDKQTEVLTIDGWKFFEDLSKNDLICTLNPKTREVEYQCPTRLISHYYNGEMVKFKHKRLDLLVTPNHRMLIFNLRGKPKFVRAKEIRTTSYVLRSGKWKGTDKVTFTFPSYRKVWYSGLKHKMRRVYKLPEKTVPIEDYLRLLGYYLSEGNFRERAIVLSQKRGKATRRKMRNLLQKLGNVYESEMQLVLSSVQMENYFKQFSKAKDKFIPKWVKNLSPNLLKVFLDAFIEGDGYVGKTSTCMYTTSRRLADDLQEIIMKIGKNAKVVFRERKQYYEIAIRNTSRTWIRVGNSIGKYPRSSTISREKYEGRVYCASVPNGILLVRRHGEVVFSGNSPDWDINLMKRFDSYMPMKYVFVPVYGMIIVGESWDRKYDDHRTHAGFAQVYMIGKENMNRHLREEEILEVCKKRSRNKVIIEHAAKRSEVWHYAVVYWRGVLDALAKTSIGGGVHDDCFPKMPDVRLDDYLWRKLGIRKVCPLDSFVFHVGRFSQNPKYTWGFKFIGD